MKRRTLAATCTIATLCIMAAPLVSATFLTSTSVSQTSISSATIQPPTGLTATGGCQTVVVGPKVTLNWTATTSAYATTYTIYRSTTNGGPYSSIASVATSQNTYTDTSVNLLSTTYYYVMKSNYLNWTSVNSTQASGTTPALCV